MPLFNPYLVIFPPYLAVFRGLSFYVSQLRPHRCQTFPARRSLRVSRTMLLRPVPVPTPPAFTSAPGIPRHSNSLSHALHPLSQAIPRTMRRTTTPTKIATPLTAKTVNCKMQLGTSGRRPMCWRRGCGGGNDGVASGVRKPWWCSSLTPPQQPRAPPPRTLRAALQGKRDPCMLTPIAEAPIASLGALPPPSPPFPHLM